ncbi:phage portal protein [uncultured Sphingomonas sp.]|uniref:phage portal protein n=1 Tax=uncultured Sphingomonas sp. TaxID=158754 RepID=UPI0025D8821F|nr:phage portal protein [uncultured Sphingomonas sp.]
MRSVSGIVGGEWPRSYDGQVRDAYLANPIAQRAVRIVAEGAAGVPVYATEEGQDAAAALLRQPGLVEAVAAQLLLHGNAFVQILGDADGLPAELFPLRPERVAVEPDARGWPAAYLYRAGEAAMRLPARDGAGRPGVIHLRALNPVDDHYGVGSLGAAAGAVAVHNAAARWNKALLDNAARPSGALVYDPGEAGAALSREQFERLKAEMEAGFAGAANAGRPMLLEGGLKWQAMSLTPADMDFVGLKAAAAREIALAFGVPPMLLGLPGDSTHANYSEANRALWRLTIVPLARKIVDGIGAGLAAWWPGLTLAIDLDGVPALASDRAALWSQVTAADFLSADEKRAMLGFGKAEA